MSNKTKEIKMSLIKQTTIAALVGVFTLSVFFTAPAKADTNPFASQELMTVVSMDDKDKSKCGEGKTKAKGKCGEGKCGEGKAKAKGKCGEGKCGEGKAKAKGKCGEGKCGEGKSKAKGKCGEGKAKDKKCGG